MDRELSEEQKEQYEQQLEELGTKALLAGIHSELRQIRVLLQDGTQANSGESKASEQLYECDFCGETIPKSELESHAVEQHKAPMGLPIEDLGTSI